MERAHTKSLDANDKLIQTRSHVRNAIASRERQVVMRKVKSTIVVKQKALEKFQSQKEVRLVLKARMEKVSPTDGSSIVEVRYFQSKTAVVLESTNLDELWTEIVEQIL